MTTAVAVKPNDGGPRLPLDQLRESATNPRKAFDQVKLVELAGSIKASGVLQPLLVRPNGKGHEIVDGARRARAAKIAGLVDVPVVVLEMTDQEVLEAQVIANLQREDVHPIEEAEGYKALLQTGFTVEDLAAKVGKSKAYVYNVLRFAGLTKPARDAFFEGKLSASTALLIARMPSDIQAKATKAITTPDYRGELPTVGEAREQLVREFMLELGSAPFPTGDADLVAAAGPCTTCPKRTGNQKELFGDVKSADVCTDPGCFKSKTEAYGKRRLTEAKEKGWKILSAEEFKKVFPWGLDHSPQQGYVKPDHQDFSDAKHRTHRELAGKEPPTPVIAQAHGQIVELWPAKATERAARKAGHKRSASSSSSSTSRPQGETPAQRVKRIAAEEERVERERVATIVLQRVYAAVHRRFLKQDLSAADWKLLFDQLMDTGIEEACDIAALRRGLVSEKDVEKLEAGHYVNTTDLITQAAAKLKAPELRALVMELAVGNTSGRGGNNAPLALLKIDAKRIRADVEAERKKAQGGRSAGRSRGHEAGRPEEEQPQAQEQGGEEESRGKRS